MSQDTSVTTKPLGDSSTSIQAQDTATERDVATSTKKKELNNGEDDDDDEEEDDEDYDPTKKEEDAEISDEDDVQQEDEKVPDFSKIESTISQVKTRSQRLQQKQEKQAKFIGKFETDSCGLVKETCNLDIDLIFDDLKENRVDDYRGELETDGEREQPQKDSKGSAEVAAVSATDEESLKIRIQINYTFAGKLITESKLVDINSAEAKAYLNSTSSITSSSSSSNESQAKHRTEVKVIRQDPQTKQDVELRIKLKRPSLIDKFIALNGNNKKMKLSTLEKSRLDWASFIDKRKIGDELKRHNRNGGGYLDKQEFLGRVDYKKDEIYQRAKEEERKRQFQLQGK